FECGRRIGRLARGRHVLLECETRLTRTPRGLVDFVQPFADHLERKELFALQTEDEPESLDVVVTELSVPRLRALRLDQSLALEEADLRDGDVREQVLEHVEHFPDREVRTAGLDAHQSFARKSSLNFPICNSSPVDSELESTRER